MLVLEFTLYFCRHFSIINTGFSRFPTGYRFQYDLANATSSLKVFTGPIETHYNVFLVYSFCSFQGAYKLLKKTFEEQAAICSKSARGSL